MQPILTVEFTGKANNQEFKEESIAIHNPEELFEFISPGGGCESIPDEVDEIQMVFIKPQHPNSRNSLADKKVTLELGMIYITGPLSEIVETAEMLLDKASRGELSQAFIDVIGPNT